MSLAWRQFQYALKALGSPLSQRDRLMAACCKLVKLRTKDVPGEVAGSFDRLMGTIPRFPVKNQRQHVRDCIESMSDLQVAAAIEAIYAMHDVVAAYQPRIREVYMSAERCRPALSFDVRKPSVKEIAVSALA